MSLTREEELARLIAEQEQDALYGDRLDYSRHLSLDAPLSHDPDAGTFGELIGEQDDEIAALVGDDETFVRVVRHSGRREVTRRDVASWRWARFRRKWTYKQIADHFGWDDETVRRHIQRPWHRDSAPRRKLEAKLDIARTVYEQGVRLIDIAAELYEECGYSSPESCYQALRELFAENGIQRRPGRWKHGMRSQSTPLEVVRQYRNEKNAELRARGLTTRGEPMRRCRATTRFGRLCRRLAIRNSEHCMVHALPHPTQKWTRENVCDALRLWEAEYGTAPLTHEWTYTDDMHPNFKTVYALFGSWPAALDAAGVTPKATTRPRGDDGRFLGKTA